MKYLLFLCIIAINLSLLPVKTGLNLKGTIFYVSPSGDDNNDGSFSSPFKTLATALYYAEPGDIILLREGIYDIDQEINKNGTASAPIVISSYNGESVIFDGSNYGIDDPNNRPKFRVTASYVTFKNFEVRNSPSDGILVTEGASHNVFSGIVSHNNYFAGFAVENSASYNTFENCDSFENFDYGDSHGEHADGFSLKYNVGRGNVLEGCRAWNNSDDGYDLWEANNRVIIKYCYAWGNGFDRWNVGDVFQGDGNGFKLGPGGHLIYRCISFDNARCGFDFNDANQTEYVYNNTAFRNPYGFYFEWGNHVLKNNLSFSNSANVIGANVLEENNSWQLSLNLSDRDFFSLDSSKLKGERDKDGNVILGDFLKPEIESGLIDAGVDVGIPYEGKEPDIGARETFVIWISIPRVLPLIRTEAF